MREIGTHLFKPNYMEIDNSWWRKTISWENELSKRLRQQNSSGKLNKIATQPSIQETSSVQLKIRGDNNGGSKIRESRS